MRVRLEQRFRWPLDTVASTYLDPDFIATLAGLPKIGGAKLLDQREDGVLVHRRIAYAFTGELSSAVKAVIDPERLTWVEESTTDRTTHVTRWHIVPDHYRDRLTCAGSTSLAESAATIRVTEMDLKVHMPLVGRRVERAIASGLEDHARDEQRALDRWLTARAGGARTEP